MTIEIVDLPIENGGSFHSYVSFTVLLTVRLTLSSFRLSKSPGPRCHWNAHGTAFVDRTEQRLIAFSASQVEQNLTKKNIEIRGSKKKS